MFKKYLLTLTFFSLFASSHIKASIAAQQPSEASSESTLAADSNASQASSKFRFISCELSCTEKACGKTDEGRAIWDFCYGKCKDKPSTIFNCKKAAQKAGYVTACQEKYLQRRKSLDFKTCQFKCKAENCGSDKQVAQDCFNGCLDSKVASINNCVAAAMKKGFLDDCQKQLWQTRK